MPNLNRKMLFYLYFTAFLATANCFGTAMLDQPLKLAMSLFGGQKGRNAQMTYPMQMAPVAAPVPPVISPLAAPGGDHPDNPSTKLRQTQAQPVQPWVDSSSGGLGASWVESGFPHKFNSEPRKNGTFADAIASWSPDHHHQQPVGHKPRDIRHKPHVEPLNEGSWAGGHHSVDSWKETSWAGRPKHTGSGKHRVQPHAEPLIDSSSEEQPWNIYRPKPVPGSYLPRPSSSDESDEQIDKLWEQDKSFSRHKHTAHKADRPRHIEPLDDDKSIKMDWKIQHKSYKDLSNNGLRIIPGRDTDNFYDGGWNKKLKSRLSLKKAGNVIPVLSIAPWHKDDWSNGYIVDKKRKHGGGEKLTENVRRRHDWKVTSDEEDDTPRHIIHGKVEAKASARRPDDSVEEFPDLRSDFVIITAKPVPVMQVL